MLTESQERVSNPLGLELQVVVKLHVELTLGLVERPLVLLSAEPFLWHCDPTLTYYLKASKTMKGDLSSG